MPISASCPNCKAAFQLEERLVGKKLRCQKCQTVFTAPTPMIPPKPVPEIPSMDLDNVSEDEEIVDAEIVQPLAAQEEIIDAKIVKLPGKKPPPPASNPSPKKVPPASRTPSPPAASSAGALIVIGLALVLCLGTVVVGGIGGFWLMLRQPNPGPIAVAPPREERPIDIDERDFVPKEKIVAKMDPAKFDDRFAKTDPAKFDDRFAKTEPPKKNLTKEEGPFSNAELLTAGKDGKAFVRGKFRHVDVKALDGTVIETIRMNVYRVAMEKGQRYHILTEGKILRPDIEVYYAGKSRAHHVGNLFTFVAEFTAEHHISIRPADRSDHDEFELTVARVTGRPVTSLKVSGQVRDEIRIEDQLFREYSFSTRKGGNYRIEVVGEKFPLTMEVQVDGVRSSTIYDNLLGKQAVYMHRAAADEVITIKIAGAESRIGSFTITVLDTDETAWDVNQALRIDGKEVNGATISELKPVGTLKEFGAVAWLPGGKAFCYVTTDGFLHRVAVPTLVEDRKSLVAAEKRGRSTEPARIASTSVGIVADRTDLKEAWLIDSETLGVKKRFRDCVFGLKSNPASAILLFENSSDRDSLFRYDLSKLEMPPQKLAHAYTKSSNIVDFGRITSPDGRFFLGFGRLGSNVLLCKVESDKIRSESLPIKFSGGYDTVISSNQQILLLPFDLNFHDDARQRKLLDSGHGWIGFRLDNPKDPAFGIDTGAPTSQLWCDPKYGCYYTYNSLKGLIVADSAGKILREIKLVNDGEARNDGRTEIAVHPDGGKLLINVEIKQHRRFFFVELSKDILNAKAIVPVPKIEPRKNEVVFDAKGRFVVKDFLAKEDARRIGESKNAPAFKSYSIKMEAGTTYHILQRSNEIDSYLELLDEQGKRIRMDDDNGGFLDAAIMFRADKAGIYEIRASATNEKFGNFALYVAPFIIQQPQVTNTTLKTQKSAKDGLQVTDVQFAPGLVLPQCASWSKDGKAICTIDMSGIVRRIRVPDFVEEKRVHLGKSGGLRLLPHADEIAIQHVTDGLTWGIDSATLDIRSVSFLYSPSTIFSSSESAVMIATGVRHTSDRIPFSACIEADLHTHTTTVQPLPGRTVLLGASHDMRLLFARDAQNKLVRLSKKAETWEIDQTGDPLPTLWPLQSIVLSTDGELLLRPYDNRSIPKEKLDPAPTSGVGVVAYRVKDITKPAFVIDTGSLSGAPTSDPRTGNIYVHSPVKGLMVFDRKGMLVREWAGLKTTSLESAVWRMIVHPEGGKILMFTGKVGSGKALYVELPENLTPNEPLKNNPGPPNSKHKAFHFDAKPAGPLGFTSHPLWKVERDYWFANDKYWKSEACALG